MTPESYQAGSWRNTLPRDPDKKTIGIGFDMASGETVRIALEIPCAINLMETLGESIGKPSTQGAPLNQLEKECNECAVGTVVKQVPYEVNPLAKFIRWVKQAGGDLQVITFMRVEGGWQRVPSTVFP